MWWFAHQNRRFLALLHQAPRVPFWHGDQNYTAPQLTRLTSRIRIAPHVFRSVHVRSYRTPHVFYPFLPSFLATLILFGFGLSTSSSSSRLCVYVFSSPDHDTGEGDGAYTIRRRNGSNFWQNVLVQYGLWSVRSRSLNRLFQIPTPLSG